jgi:quinol monooxygenase YgiN
MIKHIVMWKLYDSAEGFSKAENAQRMKRALEELKTKIAQIRYLEVGINISNAEDALDVVLYSKFDSRDDLKAYQDHPAHLAFKEFVNDIRSHKRVVDYEV